MCYFISLWRGPVTCFLDAKDIFKLIRPLGVLTVRVLCNLNPPVAHQSGKSIAKLAQPMLKFISRHRVADRIWTHIMAFHTE